MTLQCQTCLTQWSPTVHSYLNSKKTGCPGCKKLAISKAQTKKKVSEWTKKLIGEKASQRPGSLKGVTGPDHPAYKGGMARDLKNPSTADYIWKSSIRKLFQGKCALTGIKHNLVAHHLNGFNRFPEQRYDLRTGVLITQNLHKLFHDSYGYGNNTEHQWAEFCKTHYDVNWDELKQFYYSQFFENQQNDSYYGNQQPSSPKDDFD